MNHTPAANPWRLARFVFNLTFPLRCVGCGLRLDPAYSEPICGACKSRMPLNTGYSCRSCGLPVEGDLPDDIDRYCGPCRITPPPFTQTVFPLYYEEMAREVIRIFKFHNRPSLSAPLGNLMAAALYRECDYARFDGIVPVPLHIRRLMDRGYNQAYLLAQAIGGALELPVEPSLLKKVKNTTPQMSLTRKQRLENIKGAFVATDPTGTEGKRILLVDDLMTTGATMREAAKTLKKAGAAEIACAVAARA